MAHRRWKRGVSFEPSPHLTAAVALRLPSAIVISMSLKLAALLLLGVCLLASFIHDAAARALTQTAPSSDLGPVIEYTWQVTVSSQAPDCFQRDVILVNGSFQPTLEVVQGSFLKVTPQTLVTLIL